MDVDTSLVVGAAHRLNQEKRVAMAKATLRNPENDAMRAEWRVIGAALDEARRAVDWTKDQLAKELKRDEAQVRRWLSGAERPQADIVLAVEVLCQPFLVALAARKGCRVRTVITAVVRRRV